MTKILSHKGMATALAAMVVLCWCGASGAQPAGSPAGTGKITLEELSKREDWLATIPELWFEIEQCIRSAPGPYRYFATDAYISEDRVNVQLAAGRRERWSCVYNRESQTVAIAPFDVGLSRGFQPPYFATNPDDLPKTGILLRVVGVPSGFILLNR